MAEDRIIVYTDGSAIDNGSKNSRCGWAIKLIYKGSSLLKSGHAVGRTNNQMEMTAVYNAMKSIKDKDMPVTIYCDSQYVVKTVNREFSVGANEAAWKLIFDEAEKFKDLSVVWVKAHSDNQHNVEVDALAFKEAQNAV